MRITGTPLGIVRVHTDTQEELCRAFVRLQEFYELPLPEIQGQRFTLAQFKEIYAADNGGKFTYFEDWHGFNVPGHVVNDFMAIFAGDLRGPEREIRAAVRGLAKFYVIGTHSDQDEIEHETAHALFYLLPSYRRAALSAVSEFCRDNPELADKFSATLREWGYCRDVLPDEFQAYLATSDREWWIEELGATGAALYDAGEPFRRLWVSSHGA